jgi:hypothetical protein
VFDLCPTTLAATDESNGGLGTKITFERVIVMQQLSLRVVQIASASPTSARVAARRIFKTDIKVVVGEACL